MWSVVLYPWSLQGASILRIFAKNFLLWVCFRKNRSPLWPAILTTMGTESQCVERKGLCSSNRKVYFLFIILPDWEAQLKSYTANIYWRPSVLPSTSPRHSVQNKYWSESSSVVSDSLRPHVLYRLYNSLGQNTGVNSLSPLQGIFPTQGSNPDLLHCRRILYQLSHQESINTEIIS